MTTTAGQSHSDRDRAPPQPPCRAAWPPGSAPGCIAPRCCSRGSTRPGRAPWPRPCVGRPELAAWVDTVVTDLDDWAQTPAVRSLGLFADGFSHLLPSSPEDPISPVAATGPFSWWATS